ncbi:succinate--CoA ligase subunit beta [Laspinema sp. D1]|uniref:ATP-grasp domain-containing protein n=1 Tax=Laspinema palackyanum TaxID=3231601 RepID=UPI0034733641|nr:succinate--CoA ligase subunit beta [Laspinema sp. D2b]
MDLLEYQAKELFREMGIPVLPSQRIDHPKDLKGLKIPYPVVLKSQVRAGGRGRAGGIKFVANTIDAVAAAQNIFHLPINTEYPEVLLAEAKYDTDREFYLAVVLDRAARRPLLLGSRQGGTSTELAMEQMQQVVVDEGFSPFYARRLTLKMGCTGPLIEAVSDIVEKMYLLFVEKDLDLVEINPLGISPVGEVMALDGKVTVNDEALGRHPSLLQLLPKIQPDEGLVVGSGSEVMAVPSELKFVELDGNIGLLCNGAGLTMATLDLVYAAGGKPANFVNIGGECRWDLTPELLCDRIKLGLALVSHKKNVKVVLVNLLGGLCSCTQAVKAIADYQKQSQRETATGNPQTQVKVIVRLYGSEIDQAREILQAVEVTVVENLDEAIALSVSLATNA